jgi:hypothetical protein
MIWIQVSPGIWRAPYEGFLITKIETGTIPTGKIDCKGRLERIPGYNYVAIKPGSKGVEPVRFAGINLDRILGEIAKTLQTSLF